MSGRDVRSVARAFVEAHDAHVSVVGGRITELVSAGVGGPPPTGDGDFSDTFCRMDSARHDLLAVATAAPDEVVSAAFVVLKAAEEGLRVGGGWVRGDEEGERRAVAASVAYSDAWRRFRAVVAERT